MSWAIFGQIVLLIFVFAFVTTSVKCMHNSYCPMHRKQTDTRGE